MKVVTSRFGNRKVGSSEYVPVRISLGTPKWDIGYRLEGELKDLMPFGLLQMEKEEYEIAYRLRLEKIGVQRIRDSIQRFARDGKTVVLLCYEDVRKPEKWCHRRLFAEWWEEKTGEKIEELELIAKDEPKEEEVVKKKKGYVQGLLF